MKSRFLLGGGATVTMESESTRTVFMCQSCWKENVIKTFHKTENYMFTVSREGVRGQGSGVKSQGSGLGSGADVGLK